MENDIKSSRDDTRTKVNVIRNNKHKLLISAMCRVFQLPRSTYYYEVKERCSEDDLTSGIADIFQASRQKRRNSQNQD